MHCSKLWLWPLLSPFHNVSIHIAYQISEMRVLAVCCAWEPDGWACTVGLQNVRREFVTGVLSEEELGNKIFVHVLAGSEYAERAGTLRAFDAVSRDVIHRWAFPFAPDTNLLPAAGAVQTAYTFARGNVYLYVSHILPDINSHLLCPTPSVLLPAYTSAFAVAMELPREAMQKIYLE